MTASLVKYILSTIGDIIPMSDGKDENDLLPWLLVLPSILEHSICTLR